MYFVSSEKNNIFWNTFHDIFFSFFFRGRPNIARSLEFAIFGTNPGCDICVHVRSVLPIIRGLATRASQIVRPMMLSSLISITHPTSLKKLLYILFYIYKYFIYVVYYHRLSTVKKTNKNLIYWQHLLFINQPEKKYITVRNKQKNH